MYLRIGSDEQIVETRNAEQYNNGHFHIIDEVGKIGEAIYNPDMEMFRQSKIYFDHPYISLKDHGKRLNFIAVPACFQGDIYFVLNQHKKEIHFSSDLFKIAEICKKVTVDENACDYFSVKGYFPPGTTYFSEIRRLAPRKIYKYIDESQLLTAITIEDAINRETVSDSMQYNAFKTTLDSNIQHEASGHTNGVMLSGGADSRLLALLLSSKGFPISCYSVRSNPEARDNLEDVSLAENVASIMGVRHRMVSVDFDTLQLDRLEQFVHRMPLSVHFSYYFAYMAEAMQRDGVTKAWCGQNLDNLYNFGATARFSLTKSGLADVFRRYYLCENYASSFHDVDGGNIGNRICQGALGLAGAKLYGSFKQKKFFPPRSGQELIENFSRSYDNTVFSDMQKNEDRKYFKNRKTPKQIRDEIFKQKVASYLDSGASQVVFNAGIMFGVKTVLPYSSESMIPIFKQFRLTFKDVFWPKRYIYQYIKEFKKTYGKEIVQFKLKKQAPTSKDKDLDYHKWAKHVLQSTDIGFALRGYYKNNEFPNHYTGMQALQVCLISFWKQKVFERIRSEGVDIIENEH